MQEIRPHFFCDFIFKKVFPLFIMKKEEMQEMLAARPAAKLQKSIEKQRKTMKVAIERIKDWPPARRSTP